jgi:hypothetical protein
LVFLGALGEVESCVLQLSFDDRKVTLGCLHCGSSLLRRSLCLREAGCGLLNGGVRLRAFLCRLGNVELANRSFVGALNIKGDLFLGFGQFVSSSAAIALVILACAFGMAAFAVARPASACLTLAFEAANCASTWLTVY